ncbi:putative disease resistance protein RDL6 [Camellia lanceoleosa]|uniref:Disease resistance protein RDL6 n=1 Tax=Camellia lanceoleosa TaxID=1840588 RepID=A0ACC0H829_9ERIC|nr:putative disease resistance protein RDL6 [Camellia lanceoleosa]
MAESVVAFAIKGLGVLAIQNAQFLYGMSDQVEQVQAHLRQMQCFLKDADAKQDEHETIHNLVAEIREVAYNAEAVVETFVFEVASRRGGFRKILIRSVNILSEVLARYRIRSEIETIKKNINILISSLQSYGLIAVTEREGTSSTYQRKLQFRRSYSHVIEEDFVGFQEDMKTLIKHLVNERKQNCQDKEKGEEETMMDVAECYLDELAQRCILQVQLEEYPIRYQGRFKSCKLHDLMRDLCLLKIKEENFLKVIHLKRHKNEQQQLVENSYPSSSLSSYRSSQIHRLAIVFDENVDGDLSLLKQKQVRHIRSAVFFYGGGCSHRLWEQIKPCIFNHHKLLKVLDLEAIGHRFFSVSELKLPKTIGNLIHLRYLGLRYSWFNQLPSSIGKLRYLQTLDLRTLTHPLIPNVLWKLTLLQYLYLPKSIRIENGDILRLDGLDNLEMLENFHTYYCDIKDLLKLTNLRQLREAKMWGRREDMINYLFSIINPNQQLYRHSSLSIRESDVFSGESNLLTQLLCCHHLHKLEIQGSIQVLAPPVDYQMNISLYSSSSLTQLWLEGSLLKEDPMSTLEKLPNLRSLYLDEAFVGKEMVCSAMGFPQLNYLTLKGLHNLVRWRVDKRAMPYLLTLEIRSHKKLKMLPYKLRSVLPHVQVLIKEMPEECYYFWPTSSPTSSSVPPPPPPPPPPSPSPSLPCLRRRHWEFFFQ